MPIRRLKRFVADQHYAAQGEAPRGPAIEVAAPNGTRVAVVGSGPAGLTAAWQLARQGYAVKIFEKRSAPGGFLRHAIPAYRLPARGRRRRHRERHRDRRRDRVRHARHRPRRAQGRPGFDAVLVATGTQVATRMDVPNEDAVGVGQRPGLPAPRSRTATAPDLAGKKVVVVGGGNVAMDAARVCLSARRRRGQGRLPPRPATRCRRTTSRRTTPRPREPCSSSSSRPSAVVADATATSVASRSSGCGSVSPTPRAGAAPSRSPAPRRRSTATW